MVKILNKGVKNAFESTWEFESYKLARNSRSIASCAWILLVGCH